MYTEQFVIMVHGRETKWRLVMCPNGWREEDSGYVSIYLWNTDKPFPANVRAKVKFSLVDGSGNLVNSKSMDKEYKELS